MKPLVIYHFPCADGFTAAWIFKKRFPDAELVPANYGDPPPDVTGRAVFIVDFSYDSDTLIDLHMRAKSLTVLDHHASAQRTLSHLSDPNQFVSSLPCVMDLRFDMERSGAMLAWDYCFGGEAPLLVQYIQDRDLWKKVLPENEEISAAIFSYEYTFEHWDTLFTMMNNVTGFAVLVSEGAAILRKQRKDIGAIVTSTARWLTIAGHYVPVVNAPYHLASDIGNYLAAGAVFGATYFDTPNGRKFSLRSSTDDVDVSKIAQTYGGGGHKRAAGFTVPLGWEGE